MARIEALAFDLDDTLTDWVSTVRATLASVNESLGLRLAPAELQGVERRTVDIVWRWNDGIVNRAWWWLYLEEMFDWAVVLPHEAGDPLRFGRAFREQLLEVPYPDVRPVLASLAPAIPCGLLSNNPGADAILGRFGVHGHFRAVLGMTDDALRKPAPESFALLASAMGVDPSSIAYVGDDWEADVLGSAAAGMTPIWIDRHDDGYSLPAGAHRITSLVELPSLLRTLRA